MSNHIGSVIQANSPSGSRSYATANSISESDNDSNTASNHLGFWQNSGLKGTPSILALVRHGKTEWSISGKHTGLSDLPLAEGGKEIAEKAGYQLQRSLTSYEASRLIGISSPLIRARETRSAMLSYLPQLAFPLDPEQLVNFIDFKNDSCESGSQSSLVSIIRELSTNSYNSLKFLQENSDWLLKWIHSEPLVKYEANFADNTFELAEECHYGDGEGLTSPEIRNLTSNPSWTARDGFKDIHIPMHDLSKDPRAVFTEGESLDEVMSRCSQLLDIVVLPLMRQGFSVAVFSHGHYLAVMQAMISGIDPRKIPYSEFKKNFFLPTAGFSIYDTGLVGPSVMEDEVIPSHFGFIKRITVDPERL